MLARFVSWELELIVDPARCCYEAVHASAQVQASSLRWDTSSNLSAASFSFQWSVISHDGRGSRHEASPVVARCRHGDHNRCLVYVTGKLTALVLAVPLTRHTDTAEKQLRKTLEQDLGKDLSSHKALIRAEVSANAESILLLAQRCWCRDTLSDIFAASFR